MLQEHNDKFMELSPVLELVYIMLTNMAKYLDVYATDIDASQLQQYDQAKKALAQTIKTFDGFYGLQSGATAPITQSQPQADTVDPMGNDISVGDDMDASAPKHDEKKPYEFASGDDPESLRKAKQAVDELKSLFADMKKKEAQSPLPANQEMSAPTGMVSTPVMPTQPQSPVETPQQPAPMPTFVSQQDMQQAEPTVSTPNVTPPTTAPDPVVPAQQDASEIDSILSELRKLQNKGAQQL